MRVIAGEFRSRILKEVESTDTRETKDRVKESIFNSLAHDIYDADVLDLFAGSGSMGIEAISRGANSCVFVDKMRQAIETSIANIKTLKIQSKVELYHDDYSHYLHNCTQTFDLIILDPPYKLDIIDDIITFIAENKILRHDGIIVCLYDRNNNLKTENHGIIEYKKKKSGITNISFMKWGI